MTKLPSIDDCLRALPTILDELREVRRENAELRNLVEASRSGFTKPLYDIDALRELNIGRNHAYKILRSIGTKVEGRLVVTNAQLTRYFEHSEQLN